MGIYFDSRFTHIIGGERLIWKRNTFIQVNTVRISIYIFFILHLFS